MTEKRHLVTLIIALAALSAAPSVSAAVAEEGVVKKIRFAHGTTSTVVKGTVTGYRFVDYQLRAYAGQTLKVGMRTSNLANYFNLLPPGSASAAMYIGQVGANRFDGLLPDDGIYTLRVYLMRSAARRNEHSDYTLSVSITGKPLPPVSAKIDAVIPGTPYHARATIHCVPRFAETRTCEALVIRRGFEGTATVELRWEPNWKRRILFVHGKPVAADVPQAFTFGRDEAVYVVVFDVDERFEIPTALIHGG